MTKLSSRKVSESALESTHLVMPEHTNAMGNIFGGTIMSWVDVIASVVAFRHCRSLVVTASIEKMSFMHPVKLGELVILKASINFVSTRSMEVGVKVVAENPITGKNKHTSSAYLTFVSLDENNKAQEVPGLIPDTHDEKRRFTEAKARYKERKAKK